MHKANKAFKKQKHWLIETTMPIIKKFKLQMPYK